MFSPVPPWPSRVIQRIQCQAQSHWQSSDWGLVIGSSKFTLWSGLRISFWRFWMTLGVGWESVVDREIQLVISCLPFSEAVPSLGDNFGTPRLCFTNKCISCILLQSTSLLRWWSGNIEIFLKTSELLYVALPLQDSRALFYFQFIDSEMVWYTPEVERKESEATKFERGDSFVPMMMFRFQWLNVIFFECVTIIITRFPFRIHCPYHKFQQSALYWHGNRCWHPEILPSTTPAMCR